MLDKQLKKAWAYLELCLRAKWSKVIIQPINTNLNSASFSIYPGHW